MKTGIMICGKVALAAFLFILAGNVFAQATVGADAAYKSKYMFRGLPWNTEAVFWPDIWASYKGFTVTIAGSVNLTDAIGYKNKISETDWYFDYTKTSGTASVSIGYAQYSYPNTPYPSPGEIYLKAATDLKLMAVSIAGYFDVRQAKGFYITPKFSRSFTMEKIPGFSTALNLSLGYGDEKHHAYWYAGNTMIDTVSTSATFGTLIDRSGNPIVFKPGLADLTGTLNLSYLVGKYLTVSGELGYTRLVDKHVADLFTAANSWDGKDRRGNFWFGLGLGISFPINMPGGDQ